MNFLMKTTAVSILAMSAAVNTASADELFTESSARNAGQLPTHVAESKTVKFNKNALKSPTIEIDLFGQKVTALRTRSDRQHGAITWTGTIGNNPINSVVITTKGKALSGIVNYNGNIFRITGDRKDGTVINRINNEGFGQEEPFNLPSGLSLDGLTTTSTNPPAAILNGDLIQQDILIVYTDDACRDAGGVSGGGNCEQVESDIINAIADMNQSYAVSNVGIIGNVVGLLEVDFAEEDKTAGAMLAELRSTNDGIIDNVHTVRDQLGADIVPMVTSGAGGFCGIGYAPGANPRADLMFSVTADFCLSNRTLAHEIGHNQGLSHDRETVGDTSSTANYNFGYRRCNETDGSFDATPSPHFRTTMAYGCSGAGRQALFSNPDITFQGVAAGIPISTDGSTNPANAKLRLDETAATISAFRASATPTSPNAPTGLSATASGSDTINLVWIDTSDNESNFVIQRSLDNASFNDIATLGANSTTFTDNGLSSDTTYYYRLRANNSAGSSNYSGVASSKTDAVATIITHLASAQTSLEGSISGLLSNTHSNDGLVQRITEIGSGGPKRRRSQSYSHRYNFDVDGGAGGVVLDANVWVSGSEAALFDYSNNGGNSWNRLFSVSSNNSNNVESFVFPANISGAVLIRVTDQSSIQGEATDSVNIDLLTITSNMIAGPPPNAPTGLSVSSTTATSVSLAFTDNASDEFGFDIWRDTTPGVCQSGTAVAIAPANSSNFTDTDVTPETTYYYDISAVNGGGASTCAGEVTATTDFAPAISANGTGSKVKGAQQVSLTWSGVTGSNVDIYRDSLKITTQNDGAYTDAIGKKGGGSYTYKVCETGSTASCSNEFTITF